MGTIIKKSDSLPPPTFLLSILIPEKYNSK